jgi:hypothetical protein
MGDLNPLKEQLIMFEKMLLGDYLSPMPNLDTHEILHMDNILFDRDINHSKFTITITGHYDENSFEPHR